MGAADILQAFQEATNSNDLDTAAALLASDFQFVGPAPEPMGAEQYIGFLTTLKAAFSDFSVNLQLNEPDGNVAAGTNQVSGTHDGDLDLSPMGMGVIPPTGNRFSLPAEPVEITVEDDKIMLYTVQPHPDGGIMGMMTQLGIQPPQ